MMENGNFASSSSALINSPLTFSSLASNKVVSHALKRIPSEVRTIMKSRWQCAEKAKAFYSARSCTSRRSILWSSFLKDSNMRLKISNFSLSGQEGPQSTERTNAESGKPKLRVWRKYCFMKSWSNNNAPSSGQPIILWFRNTVAQCNAETNKRSFHSL